MDNGTRDVKSLLKTGTLPLHRLVPRYLAPTLVTTLLLGIGVSVTSCAKKAGSDETEESSPDASLGSEATRTGALAKDVPYFAWVDLFISEAAPGSLQKAGTRMTPLSYPSRYSKTEFAKASLQTGINLDQYQDEAESTCASEPTAQRATCTDQLKRMHGLCAKTVMDFRSSGGPNEEAPKVACKMWTLSSGKTKVGSCTELDRFPTGEVEFREAESVTRSVRFVDVSIGAGILSSDPPSCNEAWNSCEEWRKRSPSKRNCRVLGWGIYRML